MTNTFDQLDLRIATGAEESAPIAALAPIGQLAVEQRHEVTFIEGNVGDLQTLVSGLAGQEVHVIDPGVDGLHQMAQILAGRSGIDAIHVIAHGDTAAVNFGALTLNAADMAANQDDLAAIGASLTPDGDLMLYSCDTGAGAAGQAFIDRLAASTGADVAASSNLTGSAALGGDWKLEVASGHIETQAVVDPALAAVYSQVLSISSATPFGPGGHNFTDIGGTTSTNDVIYAIGGDSNYKFKVDGADRGVASYNQPYARSDPNSGGETQITFSFVKGQVFTPTLLQVSSIDSNQTSQSLIFRGYDSAGHQVGTDQTAQVIGSRSINTVSFSGLTNIATLKVSADLSSNGGKIFDTMFLNIAMSDIHQLAPVITGVTSTSANQIYKAGDTIDISVTFDTAVHVTGTPQITLANGGSGVAATYASGDTTTTLHFNYVVQAGDTSADLDFASTTALGLNGGTIRYNGATTDAVLTLPSPGAAGSLGANSDIVVDGVAPTVTITSDHPALKVGETATITFAFSEDPGSSFTWNGSAGDVVFSSGGTLSAITGSGLTRTATFTPLALFNAGTATFRVTAGSYTDAAGNAGGAGAQLALTYDTDPPRLNITSDVSSLKIGETANVTFTFNQDPGESFTWDGSAGDVSLTLGTLSAISGTGLIRTAVFTPTAGVNENYASIVVLGSSFTDASGNTGVAAVRSFDLDTLAPAAPSAPALAIGFDTGVSSSDKLTNSTAPTFTGTGEVDATVTLYDDNGATMVGTGLVNFSGVWSINTTMGPGQHTLQATQTDVAGNVSGLGSGVTVVIDTTAPTLTITSDKASLLANQTADITFTFSEDPGSSFDATEVTVTGGTLGVLSGSGTTRHATFTPTVSINAGAASITVAADAYTDIAGNDGGAGMTPALTFDTLAPTLSITSSAPTLHAGDTATITFTFSEDPGSSFTWDGSAGDIVVSGGTLGAIAGTGLTRTATFTPTASTNGGTASITVAGGAYTDTAGNDGGAGTTPALTFDTLAPGVSSIFMTAGTDTGISSDQITSNTTPHFTGTGEANATITLYDTGGTIVLGTAHASNTGFWMLTPDAPLSSGDHTLTVKQVDGAGNVSVASPGLAVTIDTTAPTVSGVAAAGEGVHHVGDTIDIQIDFSETIKVTGAPQLTLETGATDRVATYVRNNGSALVFAYTVQAGDTTADLDYTSTSALTLNGGTIKDTAGNNASITLATPGATGSLSAAQDITIDTTAPTVSGVTSSTADGAYHVGQAISVQVNFSEAVTVTGTPLLTLETGATDRAVSYSAGDGTSTLTFTYTVQAGDTAADLDYLSTAALSLNGGTIQDAAGNDAALTLASPGAANSLGANKALAIDTTPPNAPSTPAMTSGADTGASSSDAITSNTRPSFTGTSEANAHIALYDTDGETQLGGTTADGSGNWSITPISPLDIGDHTLTVTQTDAAGNVSVASSGLAVKIDTSVAAPSALDLATASDAGSSSTDDVTNIATPTITGVTEAGASVTLYDTDGSTVLGTAVANGSGVWSIVSSTLSSTANTLTAKATDIAGNVSVASAGLVVTIDTTTPAAPGAPVLSVGSDTGTLGDGRTETTAPVITGAAGANTLVRLFDGATQVGSATADSGGHWSITSANLSIGAHTLTATQTTLAGTTSVAGAGLILTIDPPPVDAPSLPTPSEVIAAASDAIGIDINSAKALAATVVLPDGSTVANPVYATVQAVATIQAQLAAGQITVPQAKEMIIDLAFPTKGVAMETYSFFTAAAPTAAGLSYLINSDANPNDLTDPYYARFNEANRYINFAVNLGSVGEGRAAFEAGYGALTFEQAVAKAYEAVIGQQAATDAGFDPAAGEKYILGQEAYFQALGGNDVGAKAAMVGYLLSVAADVHLGPYYDAAHDLIGGQVQLVGVL